MGGPHALQDTTVELVDANRQILAQSATGRHLLIGRRSSPRLAPQDDGRLRGLGIPNAANYTAIVRGKADLVGPG